MTSRIEGDPLDQAWRAGDRRQPAVDHRPRAAARRRRPSALAGAYLEAQQRVRPALRRAGGRQPAVPRAAAAPRRGERREPACRARCRAWSRRAWTSSSRPTSRRCRRPRCSASASRSTALRHLIERPGLRLRGRWSSTCWCGRGRRLPVRPRADPRRGLRHAAQGQPARAAPAGGGLVRGRAIRRSTPSTWTGPRTGRRPPPISRPRAQQAAAYRYEQALALVERGLGARDRGGRPLRARPACRASSCTTSARWRPSRERLSRRRSRPPATTRARCRAWLGLAAVKRVTDDLDGAFADLERAEAAAERHGLDRAARAHPLPARQPLLPARQHRGLPGRSTRRAWSLARRLGSAELEAQALGGLGDAEYARGRMLTAYRHFTRLRRALPRATASAASRSPTGRWRRSPASTPATSRAPWRKRSRRIAAARRVGHQRAAIIARHASHFCTMSRGDLALARRVRRARARAGAASSAPGASRPRSLGFLGDVRWQRGRRAEGRRAGPGGARDQPRDRHGLHGADAARLRSRASPTTRRSGAAALAEGEALLAAGSISHNYLWFYREAIEAALAWPTTAAVERYAAALEDYTRAEPLPWADFVSPAAARSPPAARGVRDAATVEPR